MLTPSPLPPSPPSQATCRNPPPPSPAPLPGYFLRLLLAGLLALLVFSFPAGASSLGSHAGWFLALAAITLTTSFSYTLNFTCLGCFFTQISDPGEGSIISE